MTTAGYLSGFCPNVEILDTGIHRGDDYTLADLKDIERNFRLALGIIDPPVVVGHEEDQPLVAGMVENTGDPAVGWVTAVRMARRAGSDGKSRWVLLADLHGIHPEIAALVNARLYRKVSPEIYPPPDSEKGIEYPEGTPEACRGPILRRLGLLGGELPQIKTLRDLPPVRFSEATRFFRRAFLKRIKRVRTSDGKAFRVFSEVTGYCDTGENKGKPGVCPKAGVGKGSAAKAGTSAPKAAPATTEDVKRIYESAADPSTTPEHIDALRDGLLKSSPAVVAEAAEAVGLRVGKGQSKSAVVKAIHDRITARKAAFVRGTMHGRGFAKSSGLFAEVTAMADEPSGGGNAPDLESVVDDLIKSQPVTLTDEFIATLTPEQKAQIAATLTPGGMDEPLPEEPAAPMAEWPEGVTRETAIADLVAAGEDPESLEAMSDDELLAMWTEKMGTPEPTPMSEKPKVKPVAPAAFSPAQFAEVKRMLASVPRVKAELASLTKDVARRKQAERAATVKAFCERWNRDGHVTPSEVDPGSKTPNLYHRLMAANGVVVKKFGEKTLTDFDAAVAEIEARGPGFAVRQFRERVADPLGKQGSDPHADRVKKYYEQRRAKAGRN